MKKEGKYVDAVAVDTDLLFERAFTLASYERNWTLATLFKSFPVKFLEELTSNNLKSVESGSPGTRRKAVRFTRDFQNFRTVCCSS